MSRIQTDLLLKRAAKHASQGFEHILDFEAGEDISLTYALNEAASIPRTVSKLGLNVGYGEDAALSVEKVQALQKGLQNSHQRQNFIDGYKAETARYAAELWAYFENICLAIEGGR